MYTGVHWLYLNLAEANLQSFVPAWATYRGMIATPNILLDSSARKTHLGLTPHLVRLFRSRNIVALEKEMTLEKMRRERYPNATSRLNCIYCWPDEVTARLAPKFWANQGRHFDDRYLTDIGVSASKYPTIVDTRWVDKYVINSNQPLSVIGTDWIDSYWSGLNYPWNGDADIPREPLLECLIEGTALIYGTKLRMDAYSIVEKLSPDAVGILEKGRLGVDICTRFDGQEEWRLGQIVPVLMTNKEKTALEINHLLCLDDKMAGAVNAKVLKAGIPPSEINYQALKVFERDTFTLPDLRAINVDVSWLNSHSSLFSQVNHLLTSFFLESGGSFTSAIEHHS
jgi:hypothetical protein